jgi:hypothetical protein
MSILERFLPTKDEQRQYRQDREEILKKDLPIIQSNILNLQNEMQLLEDEIMKSEQAKVFSQLKFLYQKLHFETSRQDYIYTELTGKNIKQATELI